MPRSAKWGRLVRRFWPVFGTLEYAAGTMDAGWPPNAGEHTEATVRLERREGGRFESPAISDKNGRHRFLRDGSKGAAWE